MWEIGVMMRFSMALAGFILAATPAAHALQFSQSGATLTLSGPIEAGDDHLLRSYLSRAGASQIKLINLDSPGGMVYEAYKISEIIRAAHLNTVVDANRASCASACTTVFAGGVRRYYINAQSVVDGDTRNHGLGFHQASSWSGRVGERQYDYQGSSMMVATFNEMGVPNAAKLIDKAKFRGLYRVSGQTAWSLGIATDLKLPHAE